MSALFQQAANDPDTLETAEWLDALCSVSALVSSAAAIVSSGRVTPTSSTRAKRLSP